MNAWQRFARWLAQGLEVISDTTRALSGDPNAWEPAIARFEAQDRLTPPPQRAIVFAGSSSITFWSTLADDMAPLAAVNRGFGGAMLGDVVRYAPRIVIPYRPRAVVLFAGTNDISGRKPKTAHEVYAGYRAFVDVVQAALPETLIYYVSITPTPSRWKLWPVAQEANRLIEAHTKTDSRLRYIDLLPAILGPDGRPDRSLYRIDRLHPSKKGYAAWTGVIKPILQADLGL